MPMSGEATTNVEMASSEEMTMGKYASRESSQCVRSSRALASHGRVAWRQHLAGYSGTAERQCLMEGNRFGVPAGRSSSCRRAREPDSGVSDCVERTCALRARELRFIGVLREWK